MTWHHLKANGGMGIEEQWILRVRNAPACSLKRAVARVKLDAAQEWRASLLSVNGISTVPLTMQGSTLCQAQAECEEALREMGWTWGTSHATASA